MAGDAPALVEDLDGALDDARVDELADQPERHRVIMAVDLDMVVGGNPDDIIAARNRGFQTLESTSGMVTGGASS